MFNCIILIGRLTGDPSVSYTGEAPLARFRIAVARPVKPDADGKRPADFFDVVAWRRLADLAQNHLSKGRVVCVQGRLQIRPWKGRDGTWRTSVEVIASDIRLVGPPPSGSGAEKASQAEAPEPAPDDAADVPIDQDAVPEEVPF
jgi:single-strand DNA-binding protein